ncbi:MAG: hypothetical protein A2268_16155 [Candidatus Raymondbacteria bacterium RifOxyA12_full_50_37]|nr:MAG: hypothetical protein A2268_16155 [Candidatus Raymondbacteria bacterium RifOxyA12_full_50_37]OGJ87492.1 MAG: hypothetical protein A2350_13840 [Candidatus Raymondbacteria bacterium RifOxyB12_full_50_8]OGJ94330.1 MAG: hypothetical protein A2248_14350 [Candidatus Raymondbacteria bacterium RIFOXYA2_FULL_49_16]OGJ95272.1 MAG: hypothetical protein A2453_05775 [Candidatus Raymondbacteria bacterium RIFOXYC2_FULL_50_21]OGK04932.1 MAG: hypothetical protein A2487_19345 [Candidatus Raymondbacteria b
MQTRISSFFSGIGVLALVLLACMVLDQIAFQVYTGFIKKPGSLKYSMADLKKAYPGLNEQEITRLLTETWTRQFKYFPYTQFLEKEYSGRYVNVDAHGIRSGRQKTIWPPDTAKTNVFVFGGSTTFGCGVADTQTIPSYIGDVLGPSCAVYNLGCGHYFDTQERIRFEQLVYGGFRPDIAVFIDGINMFDKVAEGPRFTKTLNAHFENSVESLLAFLLQQSFVTYSFTSLKKHFTNTTVGSELEEYGDGPACVERYETNIAAIERTARSYGIKTFFVLQPSPLYLHDYSTDPFIRFDPNKASPYKDGYELLKNKIADSMFSAPPGFIDLSGIQEKRSDLLYVDAVHYASRFCREIADSICAQIAMAQH